ncbi:MAG TPA: ABC transporter ATP-binding protein [Alphaproteobacteria bacterium]|nr:ABC transporter ATP-binding protein [Alphaproteobacteria bacterium]
MVETLLEVRGLHTHFPILSKLFRRPVGNVRAVDGVDLDLAAGEVLGIVGESGSGKTTTGKTILKLIEPSAGSIVFEGRNITRLSPSMMTPIRRRMQIIFQDPMSSLNPRMTVGRILAAPFEIHRVAAGREIEDRVAELLAMVGLPAEAVSRYPHEFSGGQRQRIGIARALALRPRLIVADEPVSALDVSIQAQIMNLLKHLKDELKLTFILISHNLGVVSHICDRVAVMYLGRIVETAPRESLFFAPKHPYTEALLQAVPTPEPGRTRRRAVLGGDIPSPANPPSGCAFHPRCPKAMSRCAHDTPRPTRLPGGQVVACHLYGP